MNDIAPISPAQQSALVHYETMRRELATCVRIDEAATLADKAARIAAYARIRDDVEAEIWASELRLRATQRIGELSRDLDKGAGRPATKNLPTNGKNFKARALADAGISTSTAHRAEELAGGGVNGHSAALAATEKYFAEQKLAKRPPTMKGLRKEVVAAVRNATGEPKSKRAKAAAPASPTYIAWLDFVSAVKTIAEHNAASLDAMAKQGRLGGALKDTLQEARQAAKRLPRWVIALERESER
jgi:hypothetical protein